LALIVAGSAALCAYYFSAQSSVSASTHASSSQSETVRPKTDALRPASQSGAIDARDLEASTVRSVESRQADLPSAVPASTVESVGLQASRPADVEAPRRDAPVREIDREEIALLVAQGERLMSAGDIAAARTVFQRASDAGDLAATFALAASYDPAALKRLGVLGKHADLEKARSLYQRAERLGSAEATRRLQMLARR
jgi:TPR repeat protein